MACRSSLSVCAAAAVAALLAPGAAMAASQSFSAPFSFELERNYPDHIAPAALAYDGDLYFEGSQSVFLPQFDTQGGTRILESITLDLTMTIEGQILVERAPVIYFATSSQIQPVYDYEIELSGSASSGPLTATPTFDNIEGNIPDNQDVDFVEVDETESDSDTTTTDFASFLGNGNAVVDISALVEVIYPGGVAIGSAVAEGFDAFGDVSLTYVYRVPNGTVIPTPAAAGLGLALFAGLAARRRR